MSASPTDGTTAPEDAWDRVCWIAKNRSDGEEGTMTGAEARLLLVQRDQLQAERDAALSRLASLSSDAPSEPPTDAPLHLDDCDGVWPCSCVTRVSGVEPTEAMMAERRAGRLEEALRATRASHIGDARIANEMANHFPVEIRCDLERGLDKVFCDCGIVDLGWHPSVRRAKDAWALHVIDVVKAARAVLGGVDPPGEPGQAEQATAGGAGGAVAEDAGTSGGSAYRIEWAEVEAGDLIELGLFTLREGHKRERRSVLEVSWPWVVLTGDPDDPERIYRIDASQPDRIDRRLRLIHRRGTTTNAEWLSPAPGSDSGDAGGVRAEDGRA